MKTTHKVLFTIIFAFALAMSAFGQANTLRDLVGVRASAAESDLESRGYALHHTSKEESAVWTYWWNSSKKKCVMVKTEGGQYVRINDAEPADCGQKAGLSTGQKIAIALAAAAAVGGTAAIVHKAHNHDDDKHFEDSNQESDYERGFRDGQYNSTYHNWNNSTQYSSGYSAGVRQRREETSHSSGWGGYQAHQYVNDLVGSRAAGAESSMQQRGFNNRNTFKMGDASYQIWWNASTRQCIQVIVSDGRYESVKDIGSSPYCR